MVGANHKPAKKPKITVGNAPMSSMVGFTLRRSAGAMNMEVYIAPKIASGAAKTMA